MDINRPKAALVGKCMKYAILPLAALALTGCVTVPASHPVENTRTYSKSYDDVWENLMRFATRKNLPLTLVAKDSGVVYVKGLDFSKKQADCGSNPWAIVVGRHAKINIHVDRVTRKRTRVTVNTRLTQQRRYGILPPKVVQCQSTGVIENIILESL